MAETARPKNVCIGEARRYDAPSSVKTGKVTLDDRPAHAYAMTNDLAYIPPKARVY